MKITAKKIEAGHYEYRGRTIYRTGGASNSYNPWRLVGSASRSFPTFAEAKRHVDQQEEKQQGKPLIEVL